MEKPRSDFFFRNRRWLLFALAAVVFAVVRPSSQSSAELLAGLLGRWLGAPGSLFWLHALFGLGAALIALGALWRTWGAAYLGTHVVQDRSLHTERLLGDGPYRRTRNPLYFGNMLMAVGFGPLLNPYACVVLVAGMWILVRLFIRDEEAALEESGGDSYRRYCAAVPRMIPSWSARIPPSGARPRWLQGFCGEAFLWLVTVLTAGLAITLNPAWFHQRALWGAAIALVLFLWARRQSRQQPAARPA